MLEVLVSGASPMAPSRSAETIRARPLVRVATFTLYAGVVGYAVSRYWLPFGAADLLIPLLVLIGSAAIGRLLGATAARAWVLAVVLLMAAHIVSALVADISDAPGLIAQLFRLGEQIGVALVAAWLLSRTASPSTTHAKLVVTFGVVLAGDAWLQRLMAPFDGVASHPWGFYGPVLPPWITDSTFRVYGFTGNPITLGAILLFPLAHAVGGVLTAATRERRLVAVLLGLLTLSAIALTQSRSAFVGAAVVVAACIASQTSGRSRLLILSSYLIAIALAFAPLLPILSFDERPDTLNDRVLQWRGTLELISDHVIFGVGPRQFGSAYSSNYIVSGAPTDPTGLTSENFFLQEFAETGIAGLSALIGTVVSVFWMGAKVARSAQVTVRQSQDAASTLAGITGWLAASQFAVISGAESILLLWIAMGSILASRIELDQAAPRRN